MANDNGLFHMLGSSLVQRVVFGVMTVVLGFAGFLAKLEYNNIDERIDSNASGVIRALNEVRVAEDRFNLVRDEQIRRRGILDKVEADIKWLWGETDKLKADIRGTYELVLKNTKSIEDDARLVREKQMVSLGRTDRIEDRLAQIQSAIVQLEHRLKQIEQLTYGHDGQQQQQRKQ